MNPSLTTIHEAQRLLANYFLSTRLVSCSAGFHASDSSGRASISQVFLKFESDLPTASFKPRGALYALLTNLRRRNITEVTGANITNSARQRASI